MGFSGRIPCVGILAQRRLAGQTEARSRGRLTRNGGQVLPRRRARRMLAAEPSTGSVGAQRIDVSSEALERSGSARPSARKGHTLPTERLAGPRTRRPALPLAARPDPLAQVASRGAGSGAAKPSAAVAPERRGSRAVRPRESYVRTRRRLSDAGGGARGPPRSTGAGASSPGVVVEIGWWSARRRRCGFRSRRPGGRTPAPSSPRRTVHPARETGPGRPRVAAGRSAHPPRYPSTIAAVSPSIRSGASSYAAGAAMTFRPYPPTPCSASFVRKASTVRVSFALAGSAPNCR